MTRPISTLLTLALLASCTQPTTAPIVSSSAPPAPAAPAPVSIAGEWIDSTSFPGSVVVAHVTQAGAAARFTDTTYGSAGVTATGHDSAAVVGDTVLIGDCAGLDNPNHCNLALDTGLVQGATMTVVGTADNVYQYGTLVRGTYAPADPPSDTLLAGTWVSDSVAWQLTDPSCVGIVQYALVLPKATDSDSAIYQGYVYARLCGSGWAISTQNLGQEMDSVLAFEQIQPVPAPGIFAAWWLRALALDTLQNLTPADSVHGAWMPQRFYRVADSGGVGALASRRTQPISPLIRTRPTPSR
jgi:hypothetical protein